MADDLHAARALLAKAGTAVGNIRDAYAEFLDALTQLYTEYPRIYAELQRTVHLPDNDAAQAVATMNDDFMREIGYMDDTFLQTLMTDDHVETRVDSDEEQ